MSTFTSGHGYVQSTNGDRGFAILYGMNGEEFFCPVTSLDETSRRLFNASIITPGTEVYIRSVAPAAKHWHRRVATNASVLLADDIERQACGAFAKAYDEETYWSRSFCDSDGLPLPCRGFPGWPWLTNGIFHQPVTLEGVKFNLFWGQEGDSSAIVARVILSPELKKSRIIFYFDREVNRVWFRQAYDQISFLLPFDAIMTDRHLSRQPLALAPWNTEGPGYEMVL